MRMRFQSRRLPPHPDDVAATSMTMVSAATMIHRNRIRRGHVFKVVGKGAP
jgi:hypothetical protein